MVRKVRTELICAICLNYLSDPKLLACAHSFCRNCLVLYLSRERLQRAGEIECPTCRQVTQIPTYANTNVDLLQANHQLRSLVEIVTQKEMDGQPLSGSFKLPECEKHPPLKQEYYCTDCSELLCKRCMMESHRLHNYDETEMVMLSLYASLRVKIQSGKDSLELAEGAAGNLDSSKAGVVADKGQLKARIEMFFDQSRKHLDRCQSSLIETVNNVAESKINCLDKKVHQIASARSTLLEIIENLKKLADEEVTVTILTEGKQYIEAAKKQQGCLLYTSPSPRDATLSRMPSSA